LIVLLQRPFERLSPRAARTHLITSRSVADLTSGGSVPSPPTPLPKGEGCCLSDSAAYRVEDAGSFVEDFTIPEAQNRQTGGTQPAIPCSLRFGWGKVEGPIGFDHDPGLFAEEIDDKWPQRLLTTELRTVEPSIAKQSPQMPFRRSSRRARARTVAERSRRGTTLLSVGGRCGLSLSRHAAR